LFAPLQYEFFVRGLIVATLVGGLCGLIGVYIVLRRMSYIGHGLSHAIFGGAVTSYVLSINFFVGASMWGFISALLINLTTKKRGINADAAIGIVTTASFALGVALISKFKSFTRSFDAALFGNILGITETDLLAIIIVTIIAIVLIFVGYKYLLFTTFESDVAGLYGVPTAWVDAAFALLLAAIIVVSLQVLGVTMLAAAIVIPPVTAQLLTNNFHKMLIFSVIIGSLCGLGGLYISFYIDVSSGASVVLFSAIVFVFFLSFTTFQRKVVMRGKRQHEHRSGQSHEIH
tara:strand:- start:246 stop:1112 length:867 start_codon:yes stop_codon:yes gene_type:complete